MAKKKTARKSKTAPAKAASSSKPARSKAKPVSKKPAKEKKPYTHVPRKTEEELVSPLSEDLYEAWLRLKERLLELGDQKITTSGRAIMFARRTCYAFVRPKKTYLELVFFLHEALPKEMIKRAEPVSKIKWSNTRQLVHRDEVEPPLTEWLARAYELSV